MPILPNDFGWFPDIVDMAAAQATVNAALSSGEPIQFGSGRYLVEYTGPARDVAGTPFYVNSSHGRALFAQGAGQSLTFLGAADGSTEVINTSAGTGTTILFAENLDALTLDNVQFDGARGTYSSASATVASFGTLHTTITHCHFRDAATVRIGSSDTQHAQTFRHGHNTYTNINAAFSVGIKHWGVDRVIETGPSTFLNGGGGATYDGDPIYFPGRPMLDTITAAGTALTLTYVSPHTRSVGDWVEVKGADDIFFNGRFQVQTVLDATRLMVTATAVPAQTTATGTLNATFAWPPASEITIDQISTSQMVSTGQVNSVKLEDGAGTVTINEILASDHQAGTNKSTALFIGAGTANLGYDTITAGRIRGENLSDVVQIGLGSSDINSISIDVLEGNNVGGMLRVDLIDAGYLVSHGRIKELRIGRIDAGVLDSPYNNRGTVLDIGNRFGGTMLIETLIIEEMTVGSALQDLFEIAPGAVGTIIGGTGDDVFIGTNSPDVLYGADGDDTLYGDEGDDTLDGGAGNDQLTGGIGADVHVFRDGAGADIVTDFDPEFDRVDVSDWTPGTDVETIVSTYMFEDNQGNAYLAQNANAVERMTFSNVYAERFDERHFIF